MCLGRRRANLDSSSAYLFSLCETATRSRYCSKTDMCVEMLRLKGDGVVKSNFSEIGTTTISQYAAEHMTCHCKARAKCQRAANQRLSVGKTFELEQDGAEIERDIRRIGSKFNGPA